MLKKIDLNSILDKLKLLWLRGVFHVFVGSFLNKFVSMFASIIIVRLLTKSDYGLLAYIENIYSYAFIFAGLGVSNSILRFVVIEKEISRKKAFYSFAVKFGLLTNLVIILIVYLFNMTITYQTGFENAKVLLLIMIIALPFQHLIDNHLLLERAMFENTRYAYFSFITLIVILLSRVLGAYFSGIFGIVMLLVFGYFIVSIIFLINIREKYFKKVENIKLLLTEKKKVLSYSIQYMLTNGLWTVFMLNSTFLLGRLFSNPDVLADFKVAYVLPGCLSIVSSAIGTYVAPYFIKNEDNLNWIKSNFVKVIIVSTGILICCALVFFVFEKQIILFVYGERYLDIIPIMNILMISAVINGSIRYTTANILAAMGKIKYNLITSIIGIISQIIFSFALVPSFGAMGTATVELITYTIMSTVLIIMFNRKYRITDFLRK